MKQEKLNEACGNILSRVKEKVKIDEKENHKTYLNIWDIVNSGDNDIAEMFNDLKRSNAISKLALWRNYGLLTELGLNEFSDETRLNIETLVGYLDQ